MKKFILFVLFFTMMVAGLSDRAWLTLWCALMYIVIENIPEDAKRKIY